ncbi:MAG: hypothetical protein RR205_03265 [Oscillospiraceae bacterium]
MVMRQIRTGIETKAMMEKLKKIYQKEKFSKDDMVTMTVGYILNTAFKEAESISDWNKIIDSTVTIEDEFFASVKEGKTQITRFRLSEYTSRGLDELTKTFSEELGLKAQVGYSVKQVLKAAILLRNEKKEEK